MSYADIKNKRRGSSIIADGMEKLSREDVLNQTLTLSNVDADIDYAKLEEAGADAVTFQITDHKKDIVEKGEVSGDVKSQIKEKAKALNPKKEKTLKEKIQDKKEKSQKQQKDRNRQREKAKKKTRDASL